MSKRPIPFIFSLCVYLPLFAVAFAAAWARDWIACGLCVYTAWVFEPWWEKQ